ncbi:MAG: tRNA-(ms[2]io[6]A)-hydroxylase [Gammaproteobacteria bacterium]|nr:tRNA-(ms[2]io[6]A)-hydroxylase [Gammaproteobacteria bacterium]
MSALVAPVLEFLHGPTPEAWQQEALNHLPELLIDHANCEKKAASNAISLIYRYVEHTHLLQKMSRLAREELRHFEQVVDLMTKQGIEYVQLSPSRYAAGLHRLISKQEPYRLIDSLVCGAVVEARSCERFAVLIPVLPEAIGQFYNSLLKSEARHFQDYLALAENLAESSPQDIDVSERVDLFLQADAELISTADSEFRFHSGVPS